MITEKKDGNPKTEMGSKKIPYSLLSGAVNAEIAIGLMEGALKYGKQNWRQEGARASIYVDAAFRHIEKWWEGEDIDPDSGISHLSKAIASLYVLRDAMICEKMNDDRPVGTPKEWYKKYDKIISDLRGKNMTNPDTLTF